MYKTYGHKLCDNPINQFYQSYPDKLIDMIKTWPNKPPVN